MALAIAHTTPLDATRCSRLAQQGASVFELDLRLIGGRVVVTHYLDVGRLRFAQRHNWRVRLATRRTRYDSLEDALTFLPSRCRVSLDLKDDAPGTSEPLMDQLVRTLPEPASRFIVCSKRWESLRRMKEAGFETWGSIGTSSALGRIDLALTHTDAVTVRHRFLTPALVDAAHARERRVVAWTVNDVGRAVELVSWGVDAVTTDSPAVLAEVARVDRDS